MGETEGRPVACVLAASHHQGSEGLLLAPGTLRAGPKLPEGWEESPDTGHRTPATQFLKMPCVPKSIGGGGGGGWLGDQGCSLFPGGYGTISYLWGGPLFLLRKSSNPLGS